MGTAPEHRKAFTLLELAVALTLFALIGLGANTMLRSVIKAREIEDHHASRLAQVQKALWLITQDIVQMDPDTAAIPSRNFSASFIRRGWSNPLGLPRSDLLQVDYGLQGQTLKRYYTPVGPMGVATEEQTLMDGVEAFAMRMASPRAVEVALTVQDVGPLRRVIEVPDQ